MIETIFNNITKALINSKNLCNFFQASSSEMFEKNIEGELDEQSSFSPNSPYAVFKYNNHLKIQELKKSTIGIYIQELCLIMNQNLDKMNTLLCHL